MPEEDLQRTDKRRKVKGKGEKERYTHLNAGLQTMARRDQCKEIKENNRMEKTRYLFKKIRDTKGKFLAKMVTIKVRNVVNLTEAEDIKNRWQLQRRTMQKKILMTLITLMV